MNCPSCNTPLRPGASFCPSCGNPVRREERCPECNAPLVPGDAFCSNCGTAILTTGEPSFSPSQHRVPPQQNLKSVPSGYDGQARPSRIDKKSEIRPDYSANIKCEVTEENRNIIKQGFLRSFLNTSDSIEDNGEIIVIKRKEEAIGVFRICIVPLPGARGYSVQVQADFGASKLTIFISILIGLVSAGLCGCGIFLIGIFLLIFAFGLACAPAISEATMKKRLKKALNQVVSFFN